MGKERIGLLGGTFNPVHSGHLRAAEEVSRIFGLDRVLFVPSFIPPHKQTAGAATPEDRFAMVELAVRSHLRFIASPVEIEAQEKSYSVITLEKVRAIYPNAWIFFILGIDAFMEIDTWKSYRQVLEQCHFIVISRPGYDLAEARNVLPERYAARIFSLPEPAAAPVDESLLRRFRIFTVSIRAVAVSSTEIRRKIRQGGSLRGLVPKAVEAYIRKHKLYQEPND
jgi:nicotinate-nucleotide adenylyltransferase